MSQNPPKDVVEVAAHDLLAVLAPVLDWYHGDEQPARAPLDIIRDIVADLQLDRKAALVVGSAAADALALCHQIERCGCSAELTEASIMASRLREKLHSANDASDAPPTGLFGWVDIDDQLPKVGQFVLFVCDCGHDGWTEPETGKWTGRKTEGKAIVMDYGDDPDWYPCTHWAPIPDFPNDEPMRGLFSESARTTLKHR